MRFTYKLLILIDGRTVYSPVYSGVFWDQQDVMLEDVDRIEVISGPGGTLWGANAVNGGINIITKPASATEGGLVSLGGGNNELGGAFRYGGRLGNTGPVGPGYSAVDTRIAWRPRDNTELSLTLRNLFDPTHVEYGNPATAGELTRSIYAKMLWQF